jgi:hypothetical protein
MGSQQRWTIRRGIPLTLAVVTTMAVSAAVGGCETSHPPRSAASPTAVAGSTTEEQARSVIVTDASRLQWSWLVGRAEAQLTSQCMRSQGFVYAVPPPVPEPSARTVTADVPGSGDPATYGVLPGTYEPHNPGDHQPSYEYALDGAPTSTATMTLPDASTVTYETGGCTARARVRLFGSVRAYVASAYVPQVVSSRFDASLTTDGAYTSALHGWQSCMESKNWNFVNPEAAIASLQASQLRAAPLDQRQTAIAGADRACDALSHLRARRGQALAQFVQGLSSGLLTQLTTIYVGRMQAGRVAQQALWT